MSLPRDAWLDPVRVKTEEKSISRSRGKEEEGKEKNKRRTKVTGLASFNLCRTSILIPGIES